MRVFYVIYIHEEPFKTCINAARLLCNPAEKNSAHLTVRGPYKRRYSNDRLRSLSRLIEDEQIHVFGSGSFFGPNQNTVFLECDSPNLGKIWHKPDYEYRPHITLYDGSSRGIAVDLLAILKTVRVDFSFSAEGLSSLVVNSGQKNLVLRCNINSDVLLGVLGEHIDLMSAVDTMSWPERLSCLAKILDGLSNLAEPLPMAMAL